jgi:replicative DNA helicase
VPALAGPPQETRSTHSQHRGSVIALPAHPYDPSQPGPPDEAPPPHNLEAEQALLGALMFDNDVYVAIDGIVAPRDFYEPFHQRLFKAVAEDIRHGRRSEPTLLKDYFSIDPAFHEFGGLRYLADLVDRAPPSAYAADYAKQIRSVALRRDVIRISAAIGQRAREESTASGADLMGDLEREMLAIRTGKDDLGFQSWAEVSRAVVYGMDRPEDRPVVLTHIDKVDTLIGGAERGDLIVLGGRPGMGKSALAGCVALNAAMAGYGVAQINAEMNTQQLGRRALSDLAFTRYGLQAPMYRDIKRGTLNDEQRRMIAELQHEHEALPMMLVKRTGLTLGRIRAMLNRQRMLWEASGLKLSLVVIDHVGLVAPDEGGRSRQEDQSMVSGKLKELAEELDVVMLALAQLNRNVEMREDKRPMLSDLRDSGSWEQDADVVLAAYRDAYYARREKEPKGDLNKAEWMSRAASKTVECIGLKVREGDVGSVNLWASIGHNAIRSEPPEFEYTGGAFDFASLPLPL